MTSRHLTPFKKRRGQPSWSSPAVLRQNAKRHRIASAGLAPTSAEASALIADAIAAGNIKHIPIGTRTTRRTDE